MKRLFFILTVALFSCLTYAQELKDVRVFQVLQTGSKYSNESLITALTAADWCGMINPSESYVLNFDDGSQVKVLHFEQLKSDKVNVLETCVRESNTTDEAKYSISDNGYVIRFVTSKPTKPTKISN